MLKAFAEFNDTAKTKYKLVMLDFEENALQQILKDINRSEIRNEIVMTGYVPNAEMPSIINQCKVFLYPSLRESFGIPILEGMACGVPVITSNTSSMPEIAGDAACIVDPNNPHEIAEAIKRILDDSVYRTNLCENGIERVKLFSPITMAANYLELYEKVYKEIKE